MRGIIFAAIASFLIFVPVLTAAPIEIDAAGKVLTASAPARVPSNPNAVAPGDMYIEPATLHSLGFEWLIAGDSNRNARVAVKYRKAGTAAWKEGHPLLRLHNEPSAKFHVLKTQESRPELFWLTGNLFAGGIMFLEPGTIYEVELNLADPDGGTATKKLRVATKTEPQKFDGGQKLHVYPADYKGQKAAPSFADLGTAYQEAQAGDQILLHAGNYSGNYVLNKKAARDKPIVIRDAGDGQVVFKGDDDTFFEMPDAAYGPLTFRGNGGVIFDVTDAEYIWIEGIAFKKYAFPIQSAGKERGVKGLTVHWCYFEDHYNGITTCSPLCRDIYIADNVFIGTAGNYWDAEKRYPNKSVKICGQGIDIAYNEVRNHWDGLSTLGKKATAIFEQKLAALDFYNNRVQGCRDDFGEADSGQHNVRYYRNLLLDARNSGLSSQPFYGGPCWFVRNILYNMRGGSMFKITVNPAGVLVYNNTCVGNIETGYGFFNTHLHNNLFISPNQTAILSGPADPQISEFDYNGYTDVPGTPKVMWRVYNENFQPSRVNYNTFQEWTAATGYEKHMKIVSLADFIKMPPLPPKLGNTPWDALDPRLKPGSAPVDAGLVIPNITAGYAGKAPDLGALELGEELPHFGPRSRK